MASTSSNLRFRNILFDFADWSSLAGLKHIITSTKVYARILWTAIVIPLCLIFGFMVYLSIKNYLSYPSSFTSQIIFEDQTFPHISFCNVNAFKYRQMNSDPNFAAVYELMESYRNIKMGVPDADVYGLSNLDRFEMESSARQIYTTLVSLIPDDKKVKLAYSYAEVVTECTFNGKTCSSKDFTSYFHHDYGRCFTFAANRTITRVGVMTGLRLLLTANAEMSDDFSWSYMPFNERTGFRVVVHSEAQVPPMELHGVNVAAGHQTLLGISKTRVERLQEPYGKCTVNQTTDVNYYSNWEYTRATCLDSCRQRYTIEKCGCAHPAWKKPDDATYCSTQAQANCLLSLRGAQLNPDKTNQHIDTIQDCQCYDPCVETYYRMTVSLSSYPAILYDVGAGTNEQYDLLYNEQGGGRQNWPVVTTTTEDPSNGGPGGGTGGTGGNGGNGGGTDDEDDDIGDIGCLSALNYSIRNDILFNEKPKFELVPMCKSDDKCKVKFRSILTDEPWYKNWPCYYKKCNWPDATFQPGLYECKDVFPQMNFLLNSLDKPGWPGWEKGLEPTDIADCKKVEPTSGFERSKLCPSGVWISVKTMNGKLDNWKRGKTTSGGTGRKKRAAVAGPSTNPNAYTTTKPVDGAVVDMPGLGSCEAWNLNFADVEECNEWYARNGLILQVYIDSLQYTKMVQYPTFPILSVLLEIGGNAGLWLGMSLISVFELIGFLFTLLLYCLSCGKMKKVADEQHRDDPKLKRDGSISD